MTLDTPKGTRDVLPEQKILRDFIISKVKEGFETYGFLPLETPSIEMYDTLASKYAGGSEILKETFKLTDQGKRKLGLRYDLTVPFARFIAMNPNIKMPFKRYQIANVWRDGPIKLGRYREFIQCDGDIAGSSSMMADTECIALAESVFTSLGLDFEIKINNRRLLNGILEYVGVKEKDFNSVIISIDKIAKIGEKDVREELINKKIPDKKITELFSIIKTKGTNEDILIELKNKVSNKNANDGIEELEEVFNYSNLMGLKNVKLDISLARGLSYYNSTVYEVYLINSKINSSVAAGGRYDNMVGNFMESKTQVPAVGISFGLDVIYDAIYDETKLKKTLTKVYIIPIKTMNEPLKLLKILRDNKINSDIDLSQKGVSKNLDYADKYGIPYVILIGDNEIKAGRFKLRDMKTGQEEMLSEKEIIEKLRNK
jgi:histidyl-tRNA synthetase